MQAVPVVPLVTTRAIGRALSYAPPPGEAPLPGALVRVPLGGRSVRGVVVPATGEVHAGELRAIEAVLDPAAVPAGLLQVALWIASYYGSTPARALALVLPSRTAPRGERWASAVAGAEGDTPTAAGRAGDPRRRRAAHDRGPDWGGCRRRRPPCAACTSSG